MIRMFVVFLAIAVLASAAPDVAAAAQQKSSARASAKPASGAVVNINSASAGELEALPGIGAKTAARIIEYRQKNGPFKKIEELMNVRGVGEKNFLKLKPQIAVAAAPKADHEPQ
jgi:competence protein ComEA